MVDLCSSHLRWSNGPQNLQSHSVRPKNINQTHDEYFLDPFCRPPPFYHYTPPQYRSPVSTFFKICISDPYPLLWYRWIRFHISLIYLDPDPYNSDHTCIRILNSCYTYIRTLTTGHNWIRIRNSSYTDTGSSTLVMPRSETSPLVITGSGSAILVIPGSVSVFQMLLDPRSATLVKQGSRSAFQM